MLRDFSAFQSSAGDRKQEIKTFVVRKRNVVGNVVGLSGPGEPDPQDSVDMRPPVGFDVLLTVFDRRRMSRSVTLKYVQL